MKTTMMTVGVLALIAGTATARDLTIVSWGGAYSHSQQMAYNEPYMAANPDIQIINDESSPEAVAKLRAMNEAGNVTWDLVDVEASDAIRLCDEGLAEVIDHDSSLAQGSDGTPASQDFGATIVADCFIPQIVFSTTIGYRTDQLPEGTEPPSGACDLFDLETYPGRRGLNKRPIANMEWALLCDGVPYEDVYEELATEEGQQRAFAKLDTIKDKTIWWSSGAESIQLLADGEVFMGSSYNGRLFSAIVEQNQPIGMAWDWQMFDLDGWVVPTGLPEDRHKAVMDYLVFATDSQRLADQAKYISYGPARSSSIALVGKHAELGVDMKPHMPTNPANAEHTFVNNYSWWADHRDDLDAKFQAWLTN
ncbi:MAG: extracellular solute-binding protein [Rhodobacteraceae bacterium]|nr:extracellular solute-binding protein [Paracoccaceae bacterium]